MRLLLQVLVSSLVLVLCVILFSTGSYAETIVYSASVPLAMTNWNSTVSIPKFDLDPSCLQSICFELRSHVEGTAKFESFDAEPATVVINLESTITLKRPDNTTLVVVIPFANTSDNVTAYDGVFDYGGTSGRTYSGLTGDKTETGCKTDPADRALFSGSGNIVLPVTAAGTSNGSGAGNLVLSFTSFASTEVVVTYTYNCQTGTAESTWGRIKSLFR